MDLGKGPPTGVAASGRGYISPHSWEEQTAHSSTA